MICEKCGHDNKPKCVECGVAVVSGSYCSGACKKRHQRAKQAVALDYEDMSSDIPFIPPKITKSITAKIGKKNKADDETPAGMIRKGNKLFTPELRGWKK